MTVVSVDEPTAAASRVGLAALWPDLAALAGLLSVWVFLLAARWNAMPLQLWDESRNANNALEMAFGHGSWLTPTFAGAIDHWNTKPPLLIWTMAGLMRMGVAPLLAVRAASLLAAVGCALCLWAALRVWAKDRLSAFSAGVLLLSAPIFISVHGASTGDYDAPESLCILAYVLCGWRALETGRARWTALAAAALTLGILTKGVAATLALPGLALYALLRPKALAALLRDGRTWALAGGVLAMTAGYYLLRERVDPGYLAAVMHNELGGRFLQVTEHHRGGAVFYVAELWRSAQPAAACAVLALMLVAGGLAETRRLAAAGALALGALLVVLSASRSKMEWYAVPMTPFLALLGGLGLSAGVRAAGRVGRRGSVAALAAVALALAFAVAAAAKEVAAAPVRQAFGELGPQFRYGEALDALRRRGLHRVTVVEDGVFNDAGFTAYNPMLRFEAALASRAGQTVDIATSNAALPVGAAVLTCDAEAREILNDRYDLSVRDRDRGCTLLRVEARRGAD